MAVPFKNSLERLGERADGRPALSLVPKGVFFVDGFVFVRVEVQVRCEFVALGGDISGNAHVGESAGEGLLVSCRHLFFVRLAVAVQVKAKGMELRKVADINQAIIISIIIGRRQLGFGGNRVLPKILRLLVCRSLGFGTTV